jgi:hypothetical protein
MNERTFYEKRREAPFLIISHCCQQRNPQNFYDKEMKKMETTLAYLREALSNYLDYHNDIPSHIYHKLLEKPYANEEEFVRHLSQKEAAFLNHILPHEIHYAMNEQDMKRAHQLNEVYEQLL